MSASRKIEQLHSDGADLALHSWMPRNPRAAVFYLHGLQSHAGWSWQFGEYLGRRGVALFVLDRRGSGLSGGVRGDYASLDSLAYDYHVAYNHMLALLEDKQNVTLFGHCLGGSLLGGLLAKGGVFANYRSFVFCSTWLGRLHAVLSPEERSIIAGERSTELVDVDLKAHDFTDVKKYLDFISSDPLSIKCITARSRALFLEIEQIYLERGIDSGAASAHYIISSTDPIVNHQASFEVFNAITRNAGFLTVIPTNKHYIPFTDAREVLFKRTESIALEHHPTGWAHPVG
ncbi:alpha/beta fold hydrolase [Nguyenibacter vanlangensis]|uniref:Alpha/beta fold hydrolase n=1 Tax=Nguyenibacter vanlangensis TaxID=1216886 RepID=A0ABZ3D9M6_9PROT